MNAPLVRLMDTEVVLPIVAGLGLVVLVLVGSVVVLLRPSDSPNRRP
jgi:hypothetical protein